MPLALLERLRVLAVKSMFLSFARCFLAVETCSKALLPLCVRYGKSPCFLEVAFLLLVGPDYPLLILPYVDGEEFLEVSTLTWKKVKNLFKVRLLNPKNGKKEARRSR